MKLIAKKIFLLFSLILSPNFCFAAETLSFSLGYDYIITTDEPIKANLVDNSEILSVNPFFTIFNEKNVLLAHPQKVGKTLVTLLGDKNNIVLDVTVNPENAACTFKPVKKDWFEVTLLDQPPTFKDFEIDSPPINMEENR